MPIKPSDPPVEALRALKETATTMPRELGHNLAMMKELLDHPADHWPHPVYCVGLRDMAGADGLKNAELVGWRFLAKSGNERSYAIGFHPDDDGTEYVFAELDKGPYIDGIYRVLNDESLAPHAGRTTFHPAALRVNAMNISAVWLRTDDPAREVIIPLAPSPSYLMAWRHYSNESFQNMLLDRAKEKLAQDFMDA